MRASRVGVAAAVAATISITFANMAAAEIVPRPWPGPTVISGWKEGPVTVDSSSTTIATLQLPAGKWIAWAKLYVSNGDAYSLTWMTCTLGSNGWGPNHTGWVRVDGSQEYDPTEQPFTLTTYTWLGASGGQFVLTCSQDNPPSYPTNTKLTARWIKIMAMRVGTLKTVVMDSGSTATVGSGSPKVIFGSRSGPIDLQSFTATTIGMVFLDPGAWWVRTAFSLDKGPDEAANCQLLLGGSVRDAASIIQEHDQTVSELDAAAASTYGQWAIARCTADQGGFGVQDVRDVRITAIKLGTLVTYTGGRGSVTYGSGPPKVEFKTAGVTSLPGQQWKTVASVGVSTGKWMFLSKAELDVGRTDTGGLGPVQCRLRALPDYDLTEVGNWGHLTLPFAVVHYFSDPGTASLRCLAEYAGTSASQIRLSAFKLASLKNVPMN